MTIPIDNLPPIHPGEILRDELEALGLSASKFAEHLRVPVNRVTAILAGSRSVTADTALRLARYLGTTSRMWLNLQQRYDLKIAEMKTGKAIEARVQPRERAA
ncbi:MAG TPA: HigA family addiction module antitoxin [Stellaceae bacterium]|nr:HigA family addiction module antitoxin [Stellaceae bacterium]